MWTNNWPVEQRLRCLWLSASPFTFCSSPKQSPAHCENPVTRWRTKQWGPTYWRSSVTGWWKGSAVCTPRETCYIRGWVSPYKKGNRSSKKKKKPLCFLPHLLVTLLLRTRARSHSHTVLQGRICMGHYCLCLCGGSLQAVEPVSPTCINSHYKKIKAGEIKLPKKHMEFPNYFKTMFEMKTLGSIPEVFRKHNKTKWVLISDESSWGWTKRRHPLSLHRHKLKLVSVCSQLVCFPLCALSHEAQLQRKQSKVTWSSCNHWHREIEDRLFSM